MIKIENAATTGWEAAIRGMRNPMESWSKSDSVYDSRGNYVVGINDLALMKKLSMAGADHRKYMRMIVVYADIIAPQRFWAEFDTYKVGTVRNSCSLMHKGLSRDYSMDDFSCVDGLTEETRESWQIILDQVNNLRKKALEGKGDGYFIEMRNIIPMGYNYRSTVMVNYEVLRKMYHGRKNHRLPEWREFCVWIEGLPYSELITGGNNNG